MRNNRFITLGTELKKRLLKRVWGALPALFLFLLLVLMAVLFGRIGSEGERLKAEKLTALRRSRPSVNVVVQELVPMPIRDSLSLPGVVEPWVELEVLAEVPGKVVSVHMAEGQGVKKGGLIAQLEKRDYENGFASARASYELALKNLKRTENLYKEEIVPRSELDNALAKVEILRAEMKNAQLRLERTSVRAPISGRVNRLDAKEGMFLKLYDPVAVILDTSRVKVNVGIPESDVGGMRGLKDFEVTIPAMEGRTFKAGRHFLSSAPESMARLYRLDLMVKNPLGEILPGMFARVKVVKKEVPEGISVPLYAVIIREGESFVYVEDDGKAGMRMVETGILEGWRVQITRGLEAGERVIVVGHRSVGEGQRVKVVRTVRGMEDLFR